MCHLKGLLGAFRRSAALASVAALSLSDGVSAGGEKYANEGAALFAAIRDNLVKEKLCASHPDCLAKLDAYGAYGDRVNLQLYGVSEPAIVGSVVSFVARNGITVTDGVAIRVTFYKQRREALGNSLSARKTTIELDVLK